MNFKLMKKRLDEVEQLIGPSNEQRVFALDQNDLIVLSHENRVPAEKVREKYPNAIFVSSGPLRVVSDE